MRTVPMKDIIIRVEDGRLLVELSKEMYEKQAVFASAYKFTDRCVVLVEPVGEGSVGVYFKSKSELDDSELMKIAELFCNEVLDQQLRLDIEKKYGNIRDLIVEHAFSPISNIQEKVKL